MKKFEQKKYLYITAYNGLMKSIYSNSVVVFCFCLFFYNVYLYNHFVLFCFDILILRAHHWIIIGQTMHCFYMSPYICFAFSLYNSCCSYIFFFVCMYELDFEVCFFSSDKNKFVCVCQLVILLRFIHPCSV